MLIEWDVTIQVDDGALLAADVFRPPGDGRHPVILSYGPYAKGLPFQVGYPESWDVLVRRHGIATTESSNAYQQWEVVDPERWVPRGYVCVRVDSRGAGRSPGHLDPWSPRETEDLSACIEWAGSQPWSNGRVGLAGISYYAVNQWHVAARQPRFLAAICPWEGAADLYRDITRHGGIYSTFLENWYDKQVKVVQYGLGERGHRSPHTGRLVCGDETLDEEELAANRVDLAAELRSRDLDAPYYRERSAQWDRITVPLLTAGNWGGQGLHLRGNVDGFVRAASKQKWLELHGEEHWAEFYTDYGVELQQRFFDHFLKGEDNGWDRQPPVLLRVRTLDGFVDRSEQEWPLARTQWTRLHLDAADLTLRDVEPTSEAEATYEMLGDGLTFRLAPFREPTEITGPLAARLCVSSSTSDADLFLVVRLFDPEGSEVTFNGAVDPRTPLSQGWLRLSHRAVDDELSLPYRPHHPHTRVEPLEPGKVYEVDVEIWPTSIRVPAGYQLGLTVRGRDYEHEGEPVHLSQFRNALRGCGPFLHDDDDDRPHEVFAGVATIHTGPRFRSSLLVPVVPEVEA